MAFSFNVKLKKFNKLSRQILCLYVIVIKILKKSGGEYGRKENIDL